MLWLPAIMSGFVPWVADLTPTRIRNGLNRVAMSHPRPLAFLKELLSGLNRGVEY